MSGATTHLGAPMHSGDQARTRDTQRALGFESLEGLVRC